MGTKSSSAVRSTLVNVSANDKSLNSACAQASQIGRELSPGENKWIAEAANAPKSGLGGQIVVKV